jgi:hypothetical protein
MPRGSVDSVASVGSITLLSGATVKGSATSAGSVIVKPGATVQGIVTSQASLTPIETTSWVLPSQGASKGSVDVPRSQTKTLSPGTYDEVEVASGGTLALQSGTYVFGSISTDSTSTIVLNGQVAVYVTTLLDLDGVPVDSAGTPADGLLVYLGTGVVPLPGGLHATLVAPNATLSLASPLGYTGSFFANTVILGPGVPVVHATSALFSSLDACAPLSQAEQSKATSLGLDSTQVYGVSGLEQLQHLPIPAGQTWRIGLRYEVSAGQPNTAERFRILEKEQGAIVGGNTFVLRH